MPTTFSVISLGKQRDIDKSNRNFEAERAERLVGEEFGSSDDPLHQHIQEFTPTEDGIGRTNYFDQNNSEDNGFRIDGGPEQTFDGLAVYNATLTYADGSTATISAVVFQDTNGNTYLAPEMTENADQAALTAKPIQSLELNSVLTDTTLGLASDRAGSDFAAPCFTPGALIAVPGGAVAVEDLHVGDSVLTADAGPQPIRWIGRSTVPARGNMVPVRIRAGALGQGLPRRDLLVSPQHRMLLQSKIAARIVGAVEVFVPAKKLIDMPGVSLDTTEAQVTYLHLLLDRHHVIYAEGAPTESMLTGPQALQALGPAGLAELRALFGDRLPVPEPARTIPLGRKIRDLLARHRAKSRPLLMPEAAVAAGPP